MKRFFYYFGWTIVIGLFVYFGARYQFLLKQEVKNTFNLYPFVLFSTFFPVVIGILLRLPELINDIKQHKQWTFDWVKFSAIALPAFCILLMYLLMYSPVGESILPFVPKLVLLGDSTIQLIAGVVFGFTLLDSVKK